MSNHTGLLELGRVIITVEAHMLLNREDAEEALTAHARGEWMNSADDKRALALKLRESGIPIASLHCDRHGTSFWVITHPNKEITEIRLQDG